MVLIPVVFESYRYLKPCCDFTKPKLSTSTSSSTRAGAKQYFLVNDPEDDNVLFCYLPMNTLVKLFQNFVYW